MPCKPTAGPRGWPITKALGGCGKSRLDPGPWLCFPLSTTQQGCSHPSSSQKYQISTSKKAGALIQSLGSLDHSPATVLFPEGQTSTGLSIPPLPWPMPTLLPGQPKPLCLQLGREPRLVTVAPGCLPISLDLIILSLRWGPTRLCPALSPIHSHHLVKRQSEELTLINVNTLSVKSGN